MGSIIKDKKAWREFLFISLWLTLALGLAIGSSVVLRQGNILVSRVLAVLSLVIAALVTIAFIPRLARRIHWRAADLPSVGITQEGGLYLIIILIIAMAALNTGNNLLFLVLAMLLSAIVSSGVLSRLSLKGISVSLQIPDHTSAGDPVTLRITLKNHKRFIPSFSLAVEGDARRGQSLRRWAAHMVSRWKRNARSPKAGEVMAEETRLMEYPVYFPMVPPRQSVIQTVMYVFPRRGRYTLNGFKITTRFPFGFFKKAQRIEAHGEVLVYPRIFEISSDFQRLSFWNGRQPSLRRGLGDELYAYRKYQAGDDARFVDWKATAKMSQLVLKDFTKEDERRVCVLFDTHRYVDAPGLPEQFERAVSLAAGIAAHFIQEGIEVEFVLPRHTVPPGTGRMHLYRILGLLAEVRMTDGEGPTLFSPDKKPENGDTASDLLARRGAKILITGQPRAELLPTIKRTTHVIYFEEIVL